MTAKELVRRTSFRLFGYPAFWYNEEVTRLECLRKLQTRKEQTRSFRLVVALTVHTSLKKTGILALWNCGVRAFRSFRSAKETSTTATF
jgi:hypothetical protein